MPEGFPWVRFLPEADLHTFAAELVDSARTADSGGNSRPWTQMLIAWQHTAEVHSDPELDAGRPLGHLNQQPRP